MAYKNKEDQLKNQHEHYNNNKQYYLDKARKRNKRVREENIEYIYNYLLSHPCVDCGETNIIVLDFDHVRGKKEYNISMLTNCSLQKIQTEIDKCDVRCANCHRIITAKRGNFRKLSYITGLMDKTLVYETKD